MATVIKIETVQGQAALAIQAKVAAEAEADRAENAALSAIDKVDKYNYDFENELAEFDASFSPIVLDFGHEDRTLQSQFIRSISGDFDVENQGVDIENIFIDISF